jgi:PKD repeat protein
MSIKFGGCFFILFGAISAWTQPNASFLAPAAACRKETIQLMNTSANSSAFFWDFSQGDLLMTPAVTELGNFGGNIPYGVETVFDGSAWYGFIVSRDDNSLIRLSFGNSLTNTPTVTKLSGITGAIRPNDIEIVFAESEWFGFVSGVNQVVTRFDFGSSLMNVPTATALIVGSGGGDSGLDISFDGVNWFVAYSTSSPSQIGIFRLSSIRAIPSAADRFVQVIDNGNRALGDVRLVRAAGQWFCYTVSYFGGNDLMRLSFGSDPLAVPVVESVYVFTSATPFGIDIELDDGVYIGFVSTLQGDLIRFDLGKALHLPPASPINLGRFSVLSNLLKFKLKREKTNWFGWGVNWANNSIYRVEFPQPDRDVSPATSVLENPQVVFSAPGDFFISLEARDGGAAVSEYAQLLSVSNVPAPEIRINSLGVCSQHPVAFSLTSDQSLALTTWDFGDGTSSNLPGIEHTFLDDGSYHVRLSVQSVNGCKNLAQRVVSVVNPPQSDFSIPPIVTLCTNQEYNIMNTSVFDIAQPPEWQWKLNGVVVSNSQHATVLFVNSNAQFIELKATLPGCTNVKAQSISTIQEGPDVSFSVSGQCMDSPIIFDNTTIGQVETFEWLFGDGETSNQISPAHIFSLPGKFQTTLKATNSVGCENSNSIELLIYSNPQPDFSLALPPFSCSGSPAQFTDNTPVPTDSNLAQWTWNFGAGPSGVSGLQNPAFTYPAPGTYNVALTVSTDQGCTDTLEKSVTILPSPTIDFANAAACRNQPTQFTAATTANIKSYQWTIGSNTYTLANPTHVFGAPGSTNVSLRVVAQNDCVATVSKAVVVPAELTPDFAVANACAGRTSALTNSTLAPNDPVQHVQWLINNQPFQGSAVNAQFSQAGSFPVRMQITAQSGCTYVLNRNLVVNPTPTAGFSVSDDAGPAPFRVLFTNSSQGATTYLWRFNDAAGSTNTSVNPEFVFNSLGTYGVDLIATNAFNCADRVTQQVRVITPLPDMELLDFRVVQDPATKLLVNQVDIKNNSNYTIRETPVLLNVGVGLAFREVVRAEWRPGSVRTVTLQNQLQPGQPLSFACAELALPGDLITGNNKICVPLAESTVWLAAYPNPATDFLTVPLITAKQGLITIQLLHSTGALVYEKALDQREIGLREWTLPVDNLTNGLYTLIVRTQDGERTARILINR